MKTNAFKPGFEFIFSASLIAILCLPVILWSQTKVQKDMDISIVNGDTTINGKNIKTLSAADRQTALMDINHISADANSGRAPMANPMIMRDSAGNAIGMSGKHKDMRKRTVFKYRFNDDTANGLAPNGMNPDRMPGRHGMRFEQKNSQRFNYINVDNDGVSTHVNFNVTEASDDDLKRMPYVEGPKFEVKDLNLVPEFSSGQILLMFNLLSKTPAEVKLSDSDGKLIWNEKALNGKFSKTFALGLNGVYYLQIKQGKSISLKRIMKEE